MNMNMTTTTDSSSSMDSHSTHMNMATCKISMLWNWNTIDACFLSSSWHITSSGMFAGSCIGVICLVLCLEFLRRIGREYDQFIIRRSHLRAHTDSVLLPVRPTVVEQTVRALLHMLQFAVAYFVMLLAMYFNGYIIICIFIGAFLGSFIFSWEPLRVGKENDATAVTKCCG
ncbi:Copper Transporter integral membrane protein that functions in high affinity copper transport [Aspergillus nanangensis]|uniref:Copper transport protein n=1 Tax=Aspergillus nanangensis TaxID=2582783 RepID=A0AAD4CDA7_ASPNN|nr:Copper Transporter integral membrane protein that functions in high affinity copper transport [Aspergillus nanangensis]